MPDDQSSSDRETDGPVPTDGDVLLFLARRILLSSVPLNCPAKSRFQGCRGPESKFPKSSARIQAAPGLTVGLRRIPDHPSSVSHQLRDELYKFADAHLEACTEVYGLVTSILLRRQDDCLRCILHVKEISTRGSRAPYRDLWPAAIPGFHEPSYQSGNDRGCYQGRSCREDRGDWQKSSR